MRRNIASLVDLGISMAVPQDEPNAGAIFWTLVEVAFYGLATVFMTPSMSR